MQYFGNSHKEDIHGVGLVFEPNFFRLYYYGDREAERLVATENVKHGSEPEFNNLSNLYPLYALTFNAHYTLMPNDLFDEDHAQEILAFNTESKSPNVDWNADPYHKAKIVFERDIHSEQYLDKLFPGLQLRHGVHALLAYCRNFKSSENYSVLLQNGEKYTLAIFRSKKVIFLNTIDAKHPEDVVYFLLYTFKTLEVNRNNPLFLFGKSIEIKHVESDLSNYLKDVQNQSPIPTKLLLNKEETAEHWIGVYAYLCAL